MEEQIRRKRKILLVMPLPVVPFLALLFYSLGGGTPMKATAGATKGINTNIPSAELSSDNPTDKLSLYQQAERDSIKQRELMKSDGFFADMETANGVGPDGAVTNPFGGGYGHPTTPATTAYSRSRQTEVRIQEKMAALERELQSMDTSRAPVPPNRAYPGQLDGGLGNPPPDLVVTPPTVPPDPEMAQLNDMLDKVLQITNPQLAHEQARKASEADNSRVFPVVVHGKEDVTDFFQAKPRALAADTAAAPGSDRQAPSKEASGPTLSVLPSPNRFYDLEDGGSHPPATAIAAVIHETKAVTEKATVKLRLEQSIYVKGQLIPAGTFVYGKCRMNGDRMLIPVEEIRYGKAVFPVSLSVYGLDGLEGVHIEGSITGDATRQGASDALQSLQLAAMDPSITQQAAAAGIETVRSIVRKKTKLIKMTLKADHPVLLVDQKAM